MEATLRQVVYQDADGRYFAALLPLDVADAFASNGVPIGPPRLDSLGLPLATEVRLNNELYARGILTARDALDNRPALMGALMAAFKLDAGRILDLYLGAGEEQPRAWTQPAEEQSDPSIPDRGPSRPREQAVV